MKLLKIRYITLYISCFFMLSVSAQDPIAETYVKLNFQETEISEVFKEITKQTGFTFLYKSEVLSASGRVSIATDNQSLKATLQELLKDRNLSYTVQNNEIAIVPKTNKHLKNNWNCYRY